MKKVFNTMEWSRLFFRDFMFYVFLWIVLNVRRIRDLLN